MNTCRKLRKLRWCNSRTGQSRPISTAVERPSSLTRAGCVGGLHILMPRSTALNRVVRFSLSTDAFTKSDEPSGAPYPRSGATETLLLRTGVGVEKVTVICRSRSSRSMLQGRNPAHALLDFHFRRLVDHDGATRPF